MTKAGSIHFQKCLPFLVLFVSCCFLAGLLTGIKPGVYFSGDAGLKIAQVKQIAVTGEYKTLITTQPPWVNEIWSRGCYPFKPPFVYDMPEGKVISFPPLFQWMSVPFYVAFGHVGLFVIPAASLVLLLIWLMRVLYNAGVSAPGIAGGLFLVGLGSPLTLYGATYWEHCTACLCLFAHVDFMVRKPRSQASALGLGILSGLATWLRPEAIVISGLFLMLALYDYLRHKHAAYLAFAAASAIVTGGFFVFNQAVYGNLLGAHGLQVLDNSDSPGKLTLLTHINAKLVIYFPATLLFYTLVAYLFIKRPKWPPEIYRLAFVAVVFSLVTPLVLPNAGGKQWGPRYFLPLVPICTVALCLALKQLQARVLPQKASITVMAIVIMAYSAYLNTYQAAKALRSDYAFRVFPALHYIRTNPTEVVIVQNQFTAQELADMFTIKKLFLAEDSKSFAAIIPMLQSAGVKRVIYVNVTNDRKFIPGVLRRESFSLEKIGAYYVGSFTLF